MLGLSVHLEALERVLASIPLPPGSVVTLTDANSVVVARSLDASQYVGRSAAPGGRARNPFDVPASAILTGVDGVERVFGNARGRARSVAGQRRHSDVGRDVAHLADLPAQLRASASATTADHRRVDVDVRAALAAARSITSTRPRKRVSRGDLSPLQAKPMPTAEMDRLQETVSEHDHQPAEGARIDCRAGRRRAADARGAAVAAAAGDPAGAPRRDRRAGVGRGARAEQSAAGDPRLRRAAADAEGHARAGARGPDADPEGKRARQRDHPQPVALRPADVGAVAGAPARRRRVGARAAPAQARRAEHRRRDRRHSRRRS